jgi:16S rRNA (adenine1518-N6/adenine1519-N6)-dimethyltransferase
VSLSRSDVQRLLAEHGVRPSKALGQNFVTDANTIARIVRLAELVPGSTAIEIGAGLGSLTLALSAAGAKVVAIEVDRRLAAVLREVVAGSDVEVVEADALTLSWPELLAGRPGPVALVANLPYRVATPVVVRVLEEAPEIAQGLVMVQREVGERWVATPGDPAYGAVTVKVAYWSRANVVARVPASVFVPRPKVDSVLVRFVRRPEPAVDPDVVPYRRLEAVVRAGFAHRRKMLRRGLAGLVAPDAFARAGVDPSARAEELDVAAWGRLAQVAP